MNQTEHYNSPTTVGWILIVLVILVLTVYTISLIRDKLAARRNRKAELKALIEYNRRDVLATEDLFRTVQEARNDFR